MNSFWEFIEEGISGKGGINIKPLVPAFIFWITGAFLWVMKFNWEQNFLLSFFTLETTQGVLLITIAVILLEITMWFSDLLKLQLLQIMEGYWGKPFRWARKIFTKKIEKKLLFTRNRLAYLASKEEFTEKEKLEFQKLDSEDQNYPSSIKYLLPTKLGNVMRASELYPYKMFGLEIQTVFPRLWILLPDSVQKEISEARKNLDNTVKLVMLGIGLIVWSIYSFWIIPVSIFVIIWGYRRSIKASQTYGLMLRSAFDLYRFSLYEQLHLPLPQNPSEEIEYGILVSQFLERGFTEHIKTFNHS